MITVDSLDIRYKTNHGIQSAVKNVSFSVKRGSCLALVGQSGSGKTTIAKVVSGLMRQSSGSIRLECDQGPIMPMCPAWKKKVQLIFQDPDSVFNPKRTIGWHFEEAFHIWHPMISSQSKQSRIQHLLDAVDLESDCLTRFSFELSGGQKQRASLLRSLIVEPEYLILDEPLASQDASKQQSLLQLLKHLETQYSLGFLYITHDLSSLSYFADEVAVLHNGTIVEIADTQTVFSQPKHPLTIQLLHSRLEEIPAELAKRKGTHSNNFAVSNFFIDRKLQK